MTCSTSIRFLRYVYCFPDEAFYSAWLGNYPPIKKDIFVLAKKKKSTFLGDGGAATEAKPSKNKEKKKCIPGFSHTAREVSVPG